MPAVPPLRLGVNIDHVATIRNARGGELPDPVRAALLAIEAGADGITAHLREDRRHIRDDDIVAADGRDFEAAQFRDRGHRRNDRDREKNQAARRLHRAGEAHRAHDRRRPRCRCEQKPDPRHHGGTEGGRHSRLAFHRGRSGPDRGGERRRRAGDRNSYRRLVRGAGARSSQGSRSRMAAHRCGREPGEGARP